MKNSNLNNEYLDDEIDLRELLRTILNSKKLIILITLASALLAFIYLAQKEAKYQSTVIIEVGSYRLLDGEKKLIEPVSSLIKKLKVNLVYKKQLEFGDLKLNDKKLNFKSIEDRLLEIDYTSPSPEFNETIVNEAIIFSQESHVEILAKIVNSFSEKIVTIDNEVEFIKNSIKNQQESRKLNQEKEALEMQVKSIKEGEFVSEELLKLIQEKDILEMQVKSITEGEFVSEELFKLNQEKDTLELQIKLVNDQTNMTQPIRELKTKEIKSKQLLTILIGTILGFIFSVFIVFIRQAFLKEQN